MVSAKQKRLLRRRKKRVQHKRYLSDNKPAKKGVKRTGINKIYHDNYKHLFIITTILLIFSIGIIGMTYFKTGDVIYKGVSLSGGLTITLSTGDSPLDTDMLEEQLRDSFPEADVLVREITEFGRQSGVTIEAATQSGSQDSLEELESSILTSLGAMLPNIDDRASTEIIGPSLGQSFFKQVIKAVLIAFTFMGLVVFLYFGDSKTHKAIVLALTIIESMLIWYATGSVFLTILAVIFGAVLIVMYVRFSIPSAAVILAAISTILFVIAVVDLMEMRISTAGIAAFLMLIGYSVDTDILLSTRVLKRSGGTIYERVLGTVKTGLTMELTTMAATIVALVFTQSEVIREIMLIIFIGLVADVFFTWIQNVGILRWYLEKKGGDV